MTLNDFINIWSNDKRAVLVYKVSDYDEVWQILKDSPSADWDELNNQVPAEFAFVPTFSENMCKVYLAPIYAESEVRYFYISNDCSMIVFISHQEAI